jgi:hypothetical protein
MGTLIHAAYDRELQVRRLYWGLGLALLAVGVFACVLPVDGEMGAWFGAGYPAIGLALLFLLATLHHETDAFIRTVTVRIIGIAGLVGIALTLVLGNNFGSGDFLVPYGFLIALMSLAYLGAFISQMRPTTDLGYRAGLLLGAAGAAAFLIGFLRSTVPILFHSFGWTAAVPRNYFLPHGLVFMTIGLLYLAISLGFCSENRLVILTRREIALFFYSPIAYVVVFFLALLGWILFLLFLTQVTRPDAPPMIEPIVAHYILNWLPVFCVIFIVPVLTMRLMSEEKRSGTLEVLLTAPVSESSVVLSKFIAGLVIFLMLWIPWGLFLVGLRIGGGQPFDYFALLSFYVALLFTGASFIAMGLFFSCLTSNQIVAAVLTFAGMMAQLILLFIQREVDNKSAWRAIIEHVAYVNVWINSFQGVLVPAQLLFHVSFAIVWLFMAVKVLEARKWS